MNTPEHEVKRNGEWSPVCIRNCRPDVIAFWRANGHLRRIK